MSFDVIEIFKVLACLEVKVLSMFLEVASWFMRLIFHLFQNSHFNDDSNACMNRNGNTVVAMNVAKVWRGRHNQFNFTSVFNLKGLLFGF